MFLHTVLIFNSWARPLKFAIIQALKACFSSASFLVLIVSLKLFQALLPLFLISPFTSSPCPERIVLAVTDWPGPLSLPWLPASGQLVSVWVSSYRPFVECTGRWRGGSVGVGVKRTADSCYGLGRSSLSSLLLFTSLLNWLLTHSRSKSPSLLTPTHSSLSSFYSLFFVLTSITHLIR